MWPEFSIWDFINAAFQYMVQYKDLEVCSMLCERFAVDTVHVPASRVQLHDNEYEQCATKLCTEYGRDSLRVMNEVHEMCTSVNIFLAYEYEGGGRDRNSVTCPLALRKLKRHWSCVCYHATVAMLCLGALKFKL